MADRLRQSFTEEPPAYNLHDLKIKGGCLGCLQCAYDNRCVYGDSDDFHLFFESRRKAADIIFYCMETRERYLSSLPFAGVSTLTLVEMRCLLAAG